MTRNADDSNQFGIYVRFCLDMLFIALPSFYSTSLILGVIRSPSLLAEVELLESSWKLFFAEALSR